MPELPEVETIVNGLKPRLVGQVIAGVEVLESRTILFDRDLLTEVVNEYKISSVWRRGKVMLWDLSSGYSLLFHLKMTGQIIYEPGHNVSKVPLAKSNTQIAISKVATENKAHERFAGGHPTKSLEPGRSLPDSSTRVVFYIAESNRDAKPFVAKELARVFFNDQRKFGWIKLLPTAEVHRDSFMSSLGPEHDDAGSFSPAYLWSKTRNRITPIKAILLDQSVVAGVGNIYADEALHLSKIHPARKASSLSKAEVAVLFNAILTVLKLGIEHGGTTFSHFLNSDGGIGSYIQHVRVFRRQGQPCPECGALILKTRVAGRGTHYCPQCQPDPK